MKKVLVLGATGAMGRYLVPELVKLNYDVTGVGLDESAPWSVKASYIKGNAFDKEFLEDLLKEKSDGIANFMDYGNYAFSDYYKLFLENTDHYIFLSSCRVYDDKEQPIKETSPRLLDSSEDEVLRRYRTILSAEMRRNFFVRRYKESDQLLRNCGRVPPLSRIFREDELQATQTEKGQADSRLRRQP